MSESAGGDVNPNGYSCGTASSGHCYGETIGIGGLDPNPKVYGYSSKISIPTRIQSGDNFITNEFWLSSASGPGWIEAGLISLRVYGDYYFWAMTDQTTGIHTFHPLGPIAQGDANVTVSIYNTGPNRATSPDFFVDLTTDHMVWHVPVTNAMWSVADQTNMGESIWDKSLQEQVGSPQHSFCSPRILGWMSRVTGTLLRMMETCRAKTLHLRDGVTLHHRGGWGMAVSFLPSVVYRLRSTHAEG